MYFHLIVAFACWIIEVSVPSLSERVSLTLTIMGFIAFLLFLKESNANIKQQLLQQAEEAEHENKQTLSSFKGTFVAIRDNNTPFLSDFSFLIFSNGQIEIPLYCRNLHVIEKTLQSDGKILLIYYKNYILVDVAEIENTGEEQKLTS